MSQFNKATVPLVVFGMKHPYEMQILSGTNKIPLVYKIQTPNIQIQVCANLGPKFNGF